MDGRTGDHAEHFRRLSDADEGLLLAVSMQPDIGPDLPESVLPEAPGLEFPDQELVEQEAVTAESLRFGAHFRRDKVGILVPERQDAGRFDAHQGRLGRDDVLQQGHILHGKLPREPQAALGDGCAAAFHMPGNLHSIAQPVQEPDERQAQFSLLVIREFVREEIDLARRRFLDFARNDRLGTARNDRFR